MCAVRHDRAGLQRRGRPLRICCLVALGALGFAAPSIAAEWAQTYGGAGSDSASAILSTADGGFVVAGGTDSFGSGGGDAWVLKLDTGGAIAWQLTFGNASTGEAAGSITATADGGFVVVGGRSQFRRPGQAWISKVDGTGNVLWQRGFDQTFGVRVQATADGGVVVAGGGTNITSISSGEVSAWVARLDRDGGIVWEHAFGGGVTGYEYATSVQPTHDGGFIVAGVTTTFGAGGSDAWVLKLDANGSIVWQKTYGGAGADQALAVYATADGGYVVAGFTASFGAGDADALVIKLDAGGGVVWQKAIGGVGLDDASAIAPTVDGGYIIAGRTNSFGAGDLDAWVFKLDAGGDIVWQRTYGGRNRDYTGSVQPTADGGHALAGVTASFGAGDYDAWVLKLDARGEVAGCAVAGTSRASTANGIAIVGNSAAVPAPRWGPVGGVPPSGRSSALALEQCSSAPRLAAEVPALSKWALAALVALVATVPLALRRRTG